MKETKTINKSVGLGFLNQLKEDGFKYIIVPKRSRTKLLAAKVDLPLKDTDTIYEFTMDTDLEKEALKVLPKNTWIDINK